jgi:hypothetical protein
MMKKNEKSNKNELINFINSVDYINEDISNLEYFQNKRFNDDILDIEINLNNYIIELNNRLENKGLCIKSENELFR